MDKENVIDLTGDLDTLNTDMQNWQSMTLDMQKRADDACIRKYGCNNTELYNKMKEAIDKSKIVASEAGVSGDMTDVELQIAKLNKSKELQSSTGEVIIDDWVGDRPVSGYKEYLEKQFAAYQALPQSLKNMSDNSSFTIWGYNVPNMYRIMLNKWQSYMDASPEDIINKDTLQNYVDSMQESADPLQMLLRELDISTRKSNIYESAVLDRVMEDALKLRNTTADYDEDIPMVTPWFTPDEMEDITGTEIDPYTYVLGDDNTVELHEKIREAMLRGDEDEILKLGWNPAVPYTPEAMKYARQRQVKWFNENKPIQIIDLSKFDVIEEASNDTKKKKNPIIKLEPIYIVIISHEGINSKAIRLATLSRYSHAGISFDESLNKIYSFNATAPDGTSGLSIESADFYKKAKDCKIKVLTIFVSPGIKARMKEYVDLYIKNKGKTHYDWMNLFRILLNKSKDTLYSMNMVCSQFVDSVLKSCNIDITGKPSNLVIPGDFDVSSGINKVFVMFEGWLKDYSPKKIKDKVTRLIKSAVPPDSILTRPLKEALQMIFGDKNMEGLFLETGDAGADAILNEIRELLTPTPVIVEAKKLPVRMSDSGDMYIDLPSSIENEYQEAHKLLKTYEKDNIEGIKHQLARLFYNGTKADRCARKAKRKKNKDLEKQYTDLKARIWNDYTKYMKIVQKADPNFDFDDYYKHSEYNPKTVVIDRPTMKYAGNAIKFVSKLFG